MPDDDIVFSYLGGPIDSDFMRMYHAMRYTADPLDARLPLPAYTRDELCDCDPAARHAVRCPGSPLFIETIYALAEQPGYKDPAPNGWGAADDDPWPEGWRLKYVCTEHGEHHVLGEINGPRHWCAMRGRMVELAE